MGDGGSQHGQVSDDEHEAFIAHEGDNVDGEVLDDLEGEGMQEGGSSADEDEHHDGDVDHGIIEDESIHVFEGHSDAVLAVSWSNAHPDLVATGGQDEQAFVWRVGQDALQQTGGTLSTYQLPGHTDSVVAVEFNSSGSLLASASMDGTARVWNSSSGASVSTLEGPGGGLEWLCWHPKGDVVLAGSEDFTMWMWLAQTAHCMQVFSGHSGPVTAGCFTPDGKTVLSAGGEGDSSLRVWNPKTGECTSSIQGHPFHEDGLTCLSVHSDGAAVITGAQDGSLRVTNIHNSRVLASPQGHTDSVESVGFSPHLPLSASAGMDGKLVIWDATGFSERGVCQHDQGVTRLCWHPHQPLVFTACLDGIARCWDLRTAVCVRQYTGHTDAIQDIAVSPDGSMILTGSDDHTARVFQTI
eukprot:jgi/Chrzof1/7285/Cz02g17240.t1